MLIACRGAHVPESRGEGGVSERVFAEGPDHCEGRLFGTDCM